MLEDVVQDRDFAKLMKKNIIDMIVLFFEKEQNFGILCPVEDVSFNPELPQEITQSFQPLTLFFLAGYTFETARIEDDYIIFEAGFGRENIGSVVSVPLLSILQIIIDETPVLINISSFREKLEEEEEKNTTLDEDGVKNSMASFLNNPENAKFLK